MSSEQPPSPSNADQSFDPETSPSTSPKVWLLTDGLSPLAVGLARRLLENGDCVVAGIQPGEFYTPRANGLKVLLQECDNQKVNEEDEDSSDEAEKPMKDRLQIIDLDIRYTAQIQAGIAGAVEVFGRIDVLLLCRTEGMCSASIRFVLG
jgi:NAD(P)-dependent dehydrogenase (short-subunit alcohol dehydrogenase family)